MAKAGIASRRTSERYIKEGRVSINGKLVRKQGIKADIERNEITVDGRPIMCYQPKVYIMLNKPKGYVTTLKDPRGRPTIAHLVKDLDLRVFPVGRLDYDTQGLLLLTNDGDLSHVLQHPKYKIPKTYHIKVKGRPVLSVIQRLKEGILLDDKMTAMAKVRKIGKTQENTWLEMTITEGRYRQIKKMCEAVGHPVLKLKRIRFGNLYLGSLTLGKYRHLTNREIQRLKRDVLCPVE